MKKINTLIVILLLCNYSFAQRVISRTLIGSFTKIQIDSILNANGIPAQFLTSQYNVDVYKVIYKTVSFDSSETIASGLLAIPTNATGCLPLSSYQHGTVSRKEAAPSRFVGSEPYVALVLASNGYVMCEPDYLGLGDSPGIHFYQHAATEATATIDMLRSAREVCATLNVELSGQLFLSGYSQGGHATMAAHRKIQTSLANEFTVTASAPMSGAYDMSGTMVDVMLSNDPYPDPSYLAYIVVSWDTIYNLYNTLSDIFKSPYDTIMPPLFDGTKDLSFANNAMPSVPKFAFVPAQLDSFQNTTNHFFRNALRDNDVYDWKPNCPVRMLFCHSDRSVNYLNAGVAIAKMRANGCTDCDTINVSNVLDHYECAQLALLGAKSFIDPFKSTACTVGILELTVKQMEVIISPNPSTNVFELNITGIDLSAQNTFEIIDIQGRTIRSETILNFNSHINHNLVNGIYLLKVKAGKSIAVKRLVVAN